MSQTDVFITKNWSYLFEGVSDDVMAEVFRSILNYPNARPISENGLKIYKIIDIDIKKRIEIFVEESSKEDVAFEVFWEAYPKKGKAGKDKPKKKYKSILKSKKATIEELQNAVEKYSNSDVVRKGFVKEVYSWLLNERWKMDYETNVTVSNKQNNLKGEIVW